MRWLPLCLAASLCFGAPQKAPKKPSPPAKDKVHLSLTFSERNGLAFPSTGAIGLISVPILGGAALAAMMGGLKNLGLGSTDLESLPKTDGELARRLTSPESDALLAIAARLPLSCSYQAKLEADLVWDAPNRAYLVDSGTLTWTGRNHSRFDAGDHILYSKVSGGGQHRLKREEVRVSFPDGSLSQALKAKSTKADALTYDLALEIEPAPEPVVGEGGWIVHGGEFMEMKERYTTAGRVVSGSAVGQQIPEQRDEPLMFSHGLKYKAEGRVIRNGSADFSETWVAAGGAQTAIAWTFDPPKDEELVFVPGEAYDPWIPAPRPEDLPGVTPSADEPSWKPLEVKVKIRTKREGGTPRKGKLRFSLEEVSKNPGFCINFPANGKPKPDLRFAATQPPGIELKGARAGVGGTIADVAETTGKVQEATVIIESTDPGAIGKLKAFCDELDLRGLYEPTNTYALSIPRDDDGNRLADAWERRQGVSGKDRNWDGEEVAGQDAKGDGLSLQDEYRGAVVLEGGAKVWRRLSPSRKEMFILDPDGAFPQSQWKARTQIEAMNLDESLVDPDGNPDGGPRVNHAAADRVEHPVYALRVRTLPGDTDPDPARDDKGHQQPSTTTDPSFPLMAYAFSNGSIKSADYIKVFPARARLMVEHYRQWLDTGLKDPASEAGQGLRDPKNLFTVAEAQQAWGLLQDPKAREALVQKMLKVFFIHEVGHICGGLPDHQGNPPEGHKAEARACFMWNPTVFDQRRLMVLSTLGRGEPDFAYAYGNFCRDLPVPGFKCYRTLRIKDW